MYKIKFYAQINGQRARLLDNLTMSRDENKECFIDARAVLAKFAQDYIDNFDGFNDDSRLERAQYYLKELTTNNINNYYEDVTTYSFKVFKIK